MNELKKKTGKQLRASLAKTVSVIFRTSVNEKADMMKTAKSMGLSLTEYLTRLHAIARGKL